jgi:hypothetical protein
MKQIQMFNGVKKLLELKAKHNLKVLAGEGPTEGTVVTQTVDRLVLA